MMNIINKTSFPNYFNNQFIQSFMILVIALFLGYKKYSPLLISTSIGILYVYSYLIHRLFHNFPDFMSIHMDFHHNKENNKNIFMRCVNLLIELVTNIMFFVAFYLIQKLLHIDFVPEFIIFYYGFIYVSVHIINYSVFNVSPEHVMHHESSNNGTKIYNYGPDLIDHIFNTNYSKKFENYNHLIPNTLLAFVLTYYFYKNSLI